MKKKQAAETGDAAAPADALFRRLHHRLTTWPAQVTRRSPTPRSWLPSILQRASILLTSPTGSGKTLAAFLGIFDALLGKLESGTLGASVQCIYLSPLRALAYDIGKNIRAPIAAMRLEKELRIHLRTGDAPASERAEFRERAAHILITTPESLALMLAH